MPETHPVRANSSNASARARINPKFGYAHKLAHDDDRTRRHIGLGHEVDGRAVSHVDRSNVYDLCVFAHGVSSLAQANSDKRIGCGSISDNFAEVRGADIVSDHCAILIDVDLGSGLEIDNKGWVFGKIKDTFHSERAERAGLDAAFGDANQIASDHD